MWEIEYVSSWGDRRRVVVGDATRAFRMARDMAWKGKHPRVRKCRTDVWIADPETREIFRVLRQVDTLRAMAVWAELQNLEQSTGFMLWPPGECMPKKWRCAREE